MSTGKLNVRAVAKVLRHGPGVRHGHRAGSACRPSKALLKALQPGTCLMKLEICDVDSSNQCHKQPDNTLPGAVTPRPWQFLWNQPQGPPRGATDRDGQRLGIYKRFSLIPSAMEDENLGLNNHLQWSVRTHQEALHWVRSVWRCLLHLMYGHQIRSPRSYRWRKQLNLVASLNMYADALMLPDKIRQQIPQMLLGMPNLWVQVSDSPWMFFHLAYHLQIPDVYLDAVKHLVSRLVHRGDLRSAKSVDLNVCCNEDKYAILLSACAVRAKYMQLLRDRLTEWLHSFAGPAFTFPCDTFPRIEPDLKGPSIIAINNYLKDFFCREMYPVITRLEDECKVFGRDFEGGIMALRWLRDIAARPDDQLALTNAFRISELLIWAAYRKRRQEVDQNDLFRLIELAMERYTRLTTCLELDDKKVLKPNSRRMRRDKNQRKHAAMRLHCELCPRPHHQQRAYFAYTRHEDLFSGRGTRPWPLNGELVQEAERKYIKADRAREVEEASDSYLSSIGLGNMLAAQKHTQHDKDEEN